MIRPRLPLLLLVAVSLAPGCGDLTGIFGPGPSDNGLGAADNGARSVMIDVPPRVPAGASFEATVVMENTGQSTWSRFNKHFLGSENPQDNTTWGTNRMWMALNASVAPGGQYSFTAELVAPSQPGNYDFQWQMLQDAIGWFGGKSTNMRIEVCSDCSANDAIYETQVVPTAVAAGATFEATVVFRNAGTTVWTRDSGYYLGSESPMDNTTWGTNRMAMHPTSVSGPGAYYHFRNTLTAPSAPGTYTFQWQMLQDSVEWFGQKSEPITIEVSCATCGNNDARFTAQNVPATVVAGQPFDVSIAFHNTGTNAWSRDAKHYLGSHNPMDNTLWGTNRIAMGPALVVSPGFTYTFNGTLTAPSAPGTYAMQWQVLQDAVGWFGSPSDAVSIEVVCSDCGTQDATFVSQQVPTTVYPGELFSVAVTFDNTGETVWSRARGYFLGSENPRDNNQWGSTRMAMDTGATVGPGQRYTFRRTLTAPATTGTYDFRWQMLRDGVAWFGQPSANMRIEVSEQAWPQYGANPYVIDLQQRVRPDAPEGAIFVHELNGDGLMDFVVTGPNIIGAYDHWGALLWKKTDDLHLPGPANGGDGYPGSHAPGAIAGDLDGDGQPEVAYLTFSGHVRIRNGRNGNLETSYPFPGAEGLAIANFRGQGERDAVLQYSQTEVRAVNLKTGGTIWHVTDWYGIEHSQVRVADVDGDGRDEVLGPIFLDHDGSRMNGWDLPRDRGTHLDALDSLGVGDIIPGGELEIALAEQGGNNEAIVVGPSAIHWGRHRNPSDIPPSGQCSREKDPDKIALGNFDASRPGLEVMARSACGNHPWVYDSTGAIIATWNVADHAPAGWLFWNGDDEGGIDVVRAINWNGGARQHALVKERHRDGKVAVVNALTGDFVRVFDTRAARSYAADISGDSREEVIVVESRGSGNGKIKIFWHGGAPQGEQPRPWADNVYRRVRQNWNYYSP